MTAPDDAAWCRDHVRQARYYARAIARGRGDVYSPHTGRDREIVAAVAALLRWVRS